MSTKSLITQRSWSYTSFHFPCFVFVCFLDEGISAFFRLFLIVKLSVNVISFDVVSHEGVTFVVFVVSLSDFFFSLGRRMALVSQSAYYCQTWVTGAIS
mgnify:CR=1 FL=1